MNREDFFKEIAEFETTPLFLIDTTENLQEEIFNNCIYIGMTHELAQEISVDEMLAYLSKVKNNRHNQLIDSNIQFNLIYYVWFDEMAGQLRFNFINSNHSNLPFGCELEFVQLEEEIVATFLRSDYLQGITWDELTLIEKDTEPTAENEPGEFYILKVFKQIITRK
jgi:hypothetical protein